MATKVKVNGKLISRAGFFSTLISDIKNNVPSNAYGNVLVIDDGIGASFGGGAGINGTSTSDVNSIYTFTSLESFQDYVKGGELWKLAEALFNPSGSHAGISKLFFARAATTAPAEIEHTLKNGSFTIVTKDEGINANGVLASSNLSKGYGAKIIVSGTKFKYQIWHGSYKGLDAVNNVPYDNISSAEAKPKIVIESPEVSTVAELINWFETSSQFKLGFSLADGSNATGAIDATDVTAGYVLAAGGTETYASTDLDAVLNVVDNLDFVHILAMKSGSDAAGTNNQKLVNFVANNSKYDRYVVIAGGADKQTFLTGTGSSGETASFFNTDKVIVVHGKLKKKARIGFNVYSQLHKAAYVLGRCAGLPPQVPVTQKSVGIDGEVHALSDQEIEDAIAKGILVTYYDYEVETFVVGLDITSLQKNEFLINDDGTTYSWQLQRIKADLNKYLTIKGKKRFFDPEGLLGNRNTTSVSEVSKWAEGELKNRTASPQKDDLIIKAYDIQASINQDNIDLRYKFVPNTEIKAVVSTGIMVDS